MVIVENKKKQIMTKVLSFLTAILMVACSEKIGDIYLNVSSHYSNERINVSGETNLPDSTLLTIWVFNSLTQTEVGRANATVDGKGAFSVDVQSPLLDQGKYQINIITDAEQPKSVQKIIGIDGVNLKGDLVTKDILGNGISTQSIMYVGDKKAIVSSEEQLKDLVASVEDGIDKLLVAGDSLANIRVNPDPNYEDGGIEFIHATSICRSDMFKYKDELKALQSKAVRLPPAYSPLISLTTRLDGCLSCSSRATWFCDTAKTELSEYNNLKSSLWGAL